jgi:LPXTG-motif cell wall-anchored protein
MSTIHRSAVVVVTTLLVGLGLTPTALAEDDHVDGTTAHPDEGHDDGHDDVGGHADPGGGTSRLACADIDPVWTELSLGGHPISGTYNVGDELRTVELVVRDAPSGGKVVDWSSDGPMTAVVLHSGQDAATYEYEPPATGGSGLVPPLADRDGRNLASVAVCYAPTSVDVGIDLVLADSADPVEVGHTYEYVVSVDTTGPLHDAQVQLSLPREVELIDAPGCSTEGEVVRCAPSLETVSSWQLPVTVRAAAAGDAIARADLEAHTGEEEVNASAVEVTRLVGPHGGDCEDHAGDPGDDHDGEGCPGGAQVLIDSCLALDPAAGALVLPGPFSSRQYVVEGGDGVRVLVTVAETTGQQLASWESNVPVELVLTRTGRQVAEFRYDPAVLAGYEIAGPPAGSGQPRPMADIAFCLLPDEPDDETSDDTGTTGTDEPAPAADPTDAPADAPTPTPDPEPVVAPETDIVVLPLVVERDELPETGPEDAALLLLLATTLLALGAGLVRSGRDAPLPRSRASGRSRPPRGR